MSRRCFFIVNPHSSNGRTAGLWRRLEKRVLSTMGPVDFAHTRYTMHAAELAADALRNGYTTVVAVGGDGTVNEVLNGFYRGGVLVNAEAELGFLPSGTGGDLARTLKLNDRPKEQILRDLLENPTRLVDVAKASFTGPDGTRITRYFINEVSVGFSADIARNVNESNTFLGGKASFFLGVFRCLMGLRNREMRIIVDGKPWYQGPVFFTALCNGRYFGGGMKVAPHAEMTDGLLDVILVKYFTRRDVPRHIGKIYRGDHLILPQVREVQCRSVEITSSEEVPLEMDGEQPGSLTLSATVDRRAVRIVAPHVRK